MDKISIRKANLSDAANLSVLKQQVWIATYATQGIRNEFSEYVLSEFTLENTASIINNENQAVLIAERNNHIIGCAEIKFGTKCPNSSIDSPEITVLYVLDCFIGKGIGKQLLDGAILYLKQRNKSNCWLTVFHENERAIKFYTKNNFKERGSTYFEMDGNKYENKIMFLEIG